MPNSLTKGRGLFGSLKVRSGITFGAGGNALGQIAWTSALISPAYSAVSASASEERGYTTGLTSLSLLAGDFVIVAPQTALTSSIALGGARVVSANTLRLMLVNPSASLATGLATTYHVLSVRF